MREWLGLGKVRGRGNAEGQVYQVALDGGTGELG